jgi:hypothetical protein
MLKLKQRDVLNFTFRREFSEAWDSGFIEIISRPGGVFNPRLMADAEALALKAVTMDKKREIYEKRAQDDPELIDDIYAKASKENAAIKRDQFGLIYDNCVISWSTDLRDDADKVLPFDRDTFVALAMLDPPEIGAAMSEYINEIGDNEKAVAESDDASLKN